LVVDGKLTKLARYSPAAPALLDKGKHSWNIGCEGIPTTAKKARRRQSARERFTGNVIF
jgi:hypothetical protein